MKIKKLMGLLALGMSLSFTGMSSYAQTDAAPAATEELQLQQIRNATVKITFGDTAFLIDPMLSVKGAYPGFDDTYRGGLRNPFVELPMSVDEVIDGVDAVVVTHTHLDHWGDAA